MRSWMTLYRGILFVTSFGLGVSNILSAQPPSDAKALLHQSYLASGGENWTALGQVEMAGDASIGGANGSFHQVIDLKKGRDVLTVDAGPIYQKQATLEDSGWQADRSGIVTVCDTPSARVDAINESFQDRNGWFTAPENELASLGARQDHGRSFDLVAVTPPGGRKMTLWLGAADHLLYRIDELDASHQESDTVYSDYKEMDGVMMPFTIRQTNGDASQDTVLQVKTLRFSPTIDEAAFTLPRSTFQDAQLLGGKSSATVPFTIFEGNIVIEVSIDGHAAPFMLDSGGSNYLTPQGAKLLGVTGVGNVGLGGVGAAQVNGQFAHVNDLRLGSVEMHDQLFIVGSLPDVAVNRGKEAPIAGLVGAELLRRFPASIDYQRKTLTFYRPGTQPPMPPKAQALKLYFDGNHPYIQLQVDGAPGVFMIDTGDCNGATIFGPFYRTHRFPIEQPAQTILQGGVGGRGSALQTRIGTFGFGAWRLKDPLFILNFANQGAFSSDSIAGNLGYKVLKNFVFTLDYEHRVGYFLRSSEFGKPVDYNRAGLSLDRGDDGKMVVDWVNPGTPAEQAGMKVGDTVLSINGKTLEDAPPSSLDDAFYKSAGSPVDIFYRRNGEEHHAVFQLKELLPLHGTMKPIVNEQDEK